MTLAQLTIALTNAFPLPQRWYITASRTSLNETKLQWSLQIKDGQGQKVVELYRAEIGTMEPETGVINDASSYLFDPANHAYVESLFNNAWAVYRGTPLVTVQLPATPPPTPTTPTTPTTPVTPLTPVYGPAAPTPTPIVAPVLPKVDEAPTLDGATLPRIQADTFSYGIESTFFDMFRDDLGKACTYVLAFLELNFKIDANRYEVGRIFYTYGQLVKAKTVPVFGGMNDPNAKRISEAVAQATGNTTDMVYYSLFALKDGADRQKSGCGSILAGTGTGFLDSVQYSGPLASVNEALHSTLEAIGISPSMVSVLLWGIVIVGIGIVGLVIYRKVAK